MRDSILTYIKENGIRRPGASVLTNALTIEEENGEEDEGNQLVGGNVFDETNFY
ncbi:MAG TPA: hypothetical protein VLS94_08120 [Fusibacter sp.]|nr:hypothetical protein [Fusibacter sp.]